MRLGGLARGSAVNLIGSVTAAASTFALTLVLTHGLAAKDVGVFFTATSLFLLLLSIGQLGSSTGVVYFIGREEPTRRRTVGPSVLRAAIVPVLSLASLMGVLLIVLAEPIADIIDSSASEELIPCLRALGVFMPLAASLAAFSAGTRGLGLMKPTAVLDQILRPALQLVFVSAAMVLGSLPLVVLAWAAPYLPTAVASHWWWRRSLHRAIPEAPRAGLSRQFWRFTAPRALASVGQLAMQRLDIVLVAALAGLREAAIYTAASRFIVLGQMVGAAISRASQPGLARAIATRDHQTAATLYRTATAWLVLLVWPLYLVVALASATVMTVFGEEYVAGSTVVTILAVSMLVATGCGMVDTVLIMAGRTSWNLYNVMLAFTVNLVADLILIPPLGMTGAALGWAMAILCANLVPLAQIALVLKLHPFGPATLTAMAICTVAFGIVPAIALFALGDEPYVLAAAVLIAVVLGGAATWRFRELLELTSFVAEVRGRRRARR